MDPGTLVVPPRARAIVLFAHGSGSGRFSPRNRFVAETLNRAGFATLLFDLLTPEEERPSRVGAIVSRGGRPDLAGEALARVDAPTLLIVGGEDHPVLELNRWAQARLRATSELVVVPGAGHLFEEPGALEEVARLATGWFAAHFVAAASTVIA